MAIEEIDPDLDAKDEPDPDATPDPALPDTADTDSDSDAPKAKAGDDLAKWKGESRKHETRSKAEKRRADELERKLREYEDRDKSVHEKAIEEAFNRGRSEALTEAQQERRKDRLELAVTKIAAATGVKVGDGDDERTVKFADAELVQMWIERQLADGTLDASELFDEGGKVQTAALSDALADLAADKPFLLAQASNGNGGGRRPAGDPDAGKGKSSTRALEDLGPDEHYKAIRGRT